MTQVRHLELMVVEWAPARGCRTRDRRRLQVRCVWEDKDHAVAIGDHDNDAGEVGWDRGRGVGEPRHGVLADALGALGHLRQRLCGGMGARAGQGGRSRE
jgi:hypothetical protein